MAALTVRLPVRTVEAFDRMAATLALARPGPDGSALMAMAVEAFAAFDWQALKALPAPEGDRTITLAVEDPANLLELAGYLGTSLEETAARVLDVVAELGPRQAVRAANTWTPKGRSDR